MKCVTYTKLDTKLYNEWEELWEKSSFANYTNSPQWFSAVLESFDYKEYSIISIYEKKALRAIAGLVKVKKYGIPVYTIPPNDHVCGLPFLINPKDDKIMRFLHNELLSRGIVYLDNIPHDFVATLQGISNHTHAHTSSLNYFLPLQGDGQTVTLSNRKELLRRAKKVASDITLVSYAGAEKKGLQKAFAIDAVSRKQKRGYNVFASAEMRKFYKNLQKVFGSMMRINILYYKTHPIAYEIGFIVKKKYFGNQLGFAEAYKHLSPGKVISVKLVDYLFAHGVEEMDFGSGDSHLKRLITDEKRQLYVTALSKKHTAKLYVHHVSNVRTKVFDKIEKNKRLYSLYRAVKNVGKK